ncbi:MAG: acetylglutamate kinase [Defluviitaleaceae bacterium]|nr:acetylglutamate kinase [Defluviitaleaceae bacterium]
MTDYLDKARILSEALPFIQRYHGKTMVIKYGGGAMQTDEMCRSVMNDIVLLSLVGIRVVVVHGGGPEINEMLARVGKEPRFVDGLRYTDAETMDIVQMVLAGRVSKHLVQIINEQGGKAISFSGMDGQLLKARKFVGKNGADLGFVGEITSVNMEPIGLAISGGYIPVVSSVACGEEPGVAYNINADTAAAHLAAGLNAEKLILMTDVRGVMKDHKDESTLISVLSLSETGQLYKDGIIAGGMIPKVDCCVQAVKSGVDKAHILDGRVPHSLLIEILSDQGIGTMVVRD